ncbi:DNA-directed RNA polymerase III subunit RPC8 [Strongyloides ratti]|uniref:DNA-directed RNA polymerase III subunit RPC8 n=1 Tax=Strongyloides ratti TaxID=34506 RepID=A0A090L0L1_STRRB|nr:DNA-directed RNA polymerase III subunit RPC8 [Strongyloides ratti]CEF63186.1 DNA-directed RNA polymerase III subunit RPC8 [Strongyloides ratti]
MFFSHHFEDTIKVESRELNQDFTTVLIRNINKKYGAKTIQQVGLCLAFESFSKVGDTYILPGDGNLFTPVEFLFTTWRPIVNEVIQGVIERSEPEGLVISMNFFSDIFIPKDKLPKVSKFCTSQNAWYWAYCDEDGNEAAQLYMDKGKIVKFKVVETIWNNSFIESGEEKNCTEPPMKVIGTLADTGLGVISWWEQV